MFYMNRFRCDECFLTVTMYEILQNIKYNNEFLLNIVEYIQKSVLFIIFILLLFFTAIILSMIRFPNMKMEIKSNRFTTKIFLPTHTK